MIYKDFQLHIFQNIKAINHASTKVFRRDDYVSGTRKRRVQKRNSQPACQGGKQQGTSGAGREESDEIRFKTYHRQADHQPCRILQNWQQETTALAR